MIYLKGGLVGKISLIHEGNLVVRISHLTGLPATLIRNVLNAEAAATAQLLLENRVVFSPTTVFKMLPAKDADRLFIGVNVRGNLRRLISPENLTEMHKDLLEHYKSEKATNA